MKKLLLAAIILFGAVPCWIARAQNTQGKQVPDWVVEHQKEQASGKHVKKTKPPRKIAGTAVKGAKQVSPPVVKKKNS